MSCRYLGVRRAAIRNVLVIEESQGCEGHLINLAGKTSDPQPGREFIEARNPVLRRCKSNKDRLHDNSLLLEP